MATESLQVRKEGKLEELKRKLEQDSSDNQTKLNLEKQAVQFRYKLWAVLLPPIPPLLVAVAVFFTRRAREKEGVSRSRLRA
jgi:ABC-2 type transport system permease protein